MIVKVTSNWSLGKIIFLLAKILLIAGFFTRYVAFILLLLNVLLMHRGIHFTYGVDYFTQMSFFYLVLLPQEPHLLNFLKTTFYQSKTSIFLLMFKIHICLVYFFSGFDKMLGYNWWNGESIWKAIHLPNFSNDFGVNIDFLSPYPIIFIILGIGTFALELFYPITYFIKKKFAYTWIILTISMHTGIIVFLNLYYFSLVMITWNIFYLLILYHEK